MADLLGGSSVGGSASSHASSASSSAHQLPLLLPPDKAAGLCVRGGVSTSSLSLSVSILAVLFLSLSFYLSFPLTHTLSFSHTLTCLGTNCFHSCPQTKLRPFVSELSFSTRSLSFCLCFCSCVCVSLSLTHTTISLRIHYLYICPQIKNRACACEIFLGYTL